MFISILDTAYQDNLNDLRDLNNCCNERINYKYKQ